jgi:hypothetical protein
MQCSGNFRFLIECFVQLLWENVYLSKKINYILQNSSAYVIRLFANRTSSSQIKKASVLAFAGFQLCSKPLVRLKKSRFQACVLLVCSLISGQFGIVYKIGTGIYYQTGFTHQNVCNQYRVHMHPAHSSQKHLIKTVAHAKKKSLDSLIDEENSRRR